MILPILYSLNANADVKVGDQALFKVSYNTDFSDHSSFKHLEVTEVDHTRGRYSYRELMILGGTILSEVINIGSLADVSKEEENHKNCENSRIGTFETILVPAGSFTTCHVSFRPIPSLDSDELYFANVPFGLVKKSSIISSASGIIATEELVSYTKK